MRGIPFGADDVDQAAIVTFAVVEQALSGHVRGKRRIAGWPFRAMTADWMKPRTRSVYFLGCSSFTRPVGSACSCNEAGIFIGWRGSH
jgi:hypothetical protein